MPGFNGDPLAKENCLMEVSFKYTRNNDKESCVNQKSSQHTESIPVPAPAPAPIPLAEPSVTVEGAKSTIELPLPLRLTAPTTTMSFDKSKIQYRCSKCKLTFILKSQLLKHIQQIHINQINRSKNKLKYGCRICSKKFAYRESVRYHILSEHKENLQPLFKTSQDSNDSVNEKQSEGKQNFVENACLLTSFESSRVRNSDSSSSSHNIHLKKIETRELPNIETLYSNISGIFLNQQKVLVSDLIELSDALQNYELSSDKVEIVSSKLKSIITFVKTGIKNK
ncbi:uncharacterized protein LOC113380993 [Ctenocephalides felis]|nr:uncharacterized protein LOC113380993 [Ctenocephalides felis]